MIKKEAKRIQGYEQTTGSGTSDPMSPEKIASNEPTAVKRDPNQGTSGEPVSTQGTNNNNFQGKQFRSTSVKSDESTPGVVCYLQLSECGKTFSSRQELKDHTQQQH